MVSVYNVTCKVTGTSGRLGRTRIYIEGFSYQYFVSCGDLLSGRNEAMRAAIRADFIKETDCVNKCIHAIRGKAIVRLKENYLLKHGLTQGDTIEKRKILKSSLVGGNVIQVTIFLDPWIRKFEFDSGSILISCNVRETERVRLLQKFNAITYSQEYFEQYYHNKKVRYPSPRMYGHDFDDSTVSQQQVHNERTLELFPNEEYEQCFAQPSNQ